MERILTKFGFFPAVWMATALSAWGQQPTPPTTGDLPCSDQTQFSTTDTVASQPDAQGYFNLFDGTFKGWIQDCQTLHSQADRSVGAIWRVGSGADGKPIIFSTQRYPKKVGGILLTKKKFGNYEIVFDFWPTYQDDGGIFNRTTFDGNCYQTLLDYINGSGFGGPYGEGPSFTQFLHPPWKFNSDTDPMQMSIGTDEWSWTSITRKLAGNGEKFPCPASGCTKDDWLKLWDFSGWNQIKAQFYGGTGPGTGAVHMRSWMKKLNDTVWVPLGIDSTVMGNTTIPPSYIGLQVHWNTGWQENHWNLYRNIKWRPLSDKGVPTSIPVTAAAPLSRPPAFSFSADATSITGDIDQSYTIAVQDMSGRTLEKFSGKPGKVRHAFTTPASGTLLLSIRTASGVQSATVVRAIH